MPVFSNDIFRVVHRAARCGLREAKCFSSDAKKQEAQRAGVRGEAYANWYLQVQGYIFLARNYRPRGIKGEIDLVGYDGKTLAFAEVRTRTIRGAFGTSPYQGKSTRGGSHGAAISLGTSRRRMSPPV
jgi:hypothetical protein